MTKPKLSPPNAAQVDELLNYTRRPEPELGHFLHIAASTGARRGEMCALRWSNLDPKRMTLTIERSIAEVPGGIREKSTKDHAERRISLDPDTSRYSKHRKPSSQIGRNRLHEDRGQCVRVLP